MRWQHQSEWDRDRENKTNDISSIIWCHITKLRLKQPERRYLQVGGTRCRGSAKGGPACLWDVVVYSQRLTAGRVQPGAPQALPRCALSRLDKVTTASKKKVLSRLGRRDAFLRSTELRGFRPRWDFLCRGHRYVGCRRAVEQRNGLQSQPAAEGSDFSFRLDPPGSILVATLAQRKR